jgi:hypothetical protein
LSASVTQAAFDLLLLDSFGWSADWAWGMPLIILNVLIHVVGLGAVAQRASHISASIAQRRYPTAAFILLVGAATLLATCLHWTEAAIWALGYKLLGSLPDLRSAMLFSLNAMTSYGHTNLDLDARWQLLGALEALNGWLLFGLTTAFLFAVIQKTWSSEGPIALSGSSQNERIQSLGDADQSAVPLPSPVTKPSGSPHAAVPVKYSE